MPFNTAIPYPTTELSTVFLNTVTSFIDLPFEQNTVLQEMWADHTINRFNGHLLCAVSDFPSDYAMVVATRYMNDENTVSRKFKETYKHDEYSVYGIHLFPTGEWGVFNVDDADHTPQPVGDFDGLEGVEHLINTLRGRFLTTANGVYAHFNGAVNDVVAELRKAGSVKSNVDTYSTTACDHHHLGREWVAAISATALVTLKLRNTR